MTNRSAVPVDVTIQALEEVRLAHGGKLRPPDVVEAATPEGAPLHPHFTWDDERAAHEFRLYEARHLIRTVHVVMNDRPMPKYIHVPAAVPAESHYRPAEVIVNLPDEMALAIEAAVSRLGVANRAVEDLRHLLTKSGGESSKLSLLLIAEQALVTATEAVKRIQ